MSKIHICFQGEAGSGLEFITEILSKFFIFKGLSVLTNNEYQNRIRGGENQASLFIDNEEIYAGKSEVDLFFSFNKLKDEDLEKNFAYYSFLENDEFKILNNQYFIPFSEKSVEIGSLKIKNIYALGLLFSVLGFNKTGENSLEEFVPFLKEKLKNKSDKIINLNLEALNKAFDFAQNQNIKNFFKFSFNNLKNNIKLLNGNEALALGALKAGVKFMSAYPMTPASSVMTSLAKVLPDYQGVVVHAEDEISAINMVIGSAFAGVRSCTSTSGGGFALMSEALGFASMIETPIVIFEAQRPGPSTGQATKTAQGDLQMCVYTGQGDFERLVLAPGDIYECQELSSLAFYYADYYQIPVIVLTDKYLADLKQDFDLSRLKEIPINRGKITDEENLLSNFNGERFERFKDTEDGISLRSFPGQKYGMFTATSYNHTKEGNPLEDYKLAQKNVDKRAKKISLLKEKIPLPNVYGTSNLQVICWGSTKKILLEIQKKIEEDYNIFIEIVHFNHIYPLNALNLEKILPNYKKKMIVEGNFSGQFAKILKTELDIYFDDSFFQYDGKYFDFNTLYKKILNFTKQNS